MADNIGQELISTGDRDAGHTIIKMAQLWRGLRGNAFAKQCKYVNVDVLIPYPTAFPYGNGMVLHFYQQQESSTTKTVHKVINKGLKAYV